MINFLTLFKDNLPLVKAFFADYSRKVRNLYIIDRDAALLNQALCLSFRWRKSRLDKMCIRDRLFGCRGGRHK